MRLTFQGKLMLSYLLLTLVCGGALLGYLYQRLDANLSDEISRSQLSQARLAANLLARSPSGADFQALASEAKASLNSRVTIIAHDGTVQGDSDIAPENLSRLGNHLDRPEVKQARASGSGIAIRYSETLNSRMIYVAVPFISAGKTGFVRTALPLSTLERTKSELHAILWAAALAAVALSFALSWLLASITVRPLKTMSEAARKIGEGDFEQRLVVGGDDEIAHLADIMNQMAERIGRQFAELKRLEQVRTDFVANVSHELRTPVAIIKGYSDTLLEGALESDPGRSRDFVGTIGKHAKRLDMLISDLLSLSELEASGFHFEVAAHPLPTMVQHVFDMLEQKAGCREITIRNTISKNLPLVYANRQRIEQVLFNLIDNAITYTPAGGKVTVHAEHDGSMVTVMVSDNGPGIPPHHVPRIFERFYRVDPARSRECGGTGLGLAIVKHIVQLHGGTAGVRSEQGLGSTFWFTLPAA